MVNYYQHFVSNYSAIAKPLFELLAGQKQKRKGRPRTKRTAQFRKLTSADWMPNHQQAFEDLKAALVTSVVLAHPDFTRPFVLCTDASLDGLGAKLASYVFDITYIPSSKNTVADALSRQPFVRSAVRERLLRDPYSELLVKAVPVSSDSVQEARKTIEHLSR